MRTATALVLLAAATVVAVSTGGPAAARPVEETFSITVAGHYGEALFTPRNSWISVNQSNQIEQQVLSVTVLQNDVPEMFFDFSSRDGSMRYLEVGHYPDAQRYPFTDPGRPGISLSPLGFCSTQNGNFEVRDIQHDGLSITRIWITYQRYCNGLPAFGELRLGYPVPAQAEVAPEVIRWVDNYPGSASYDAPVVPRSTTGGPVQVLSVSVVGTHALDFPIRTNGCSGGLPPEGCLVRLGFVPRAAGPRHASLRVATAAGDLFVSLDGAGTPGRSEWTVDVDYEDPSMPDEHLHLPYSASRGIPYEFESQAFAADGILWHARYDLAGNATFTEGRYTLASGLLMSLSRGNDACQVDRATVDIANIDFTGPDDELSLLDLTMDVHCQSASGNTTRGRLTFRDRDDLTAPAAVSGLTAARDGRQVTLTWTNPGAPDLAGVLVRWYPGPIAPTATDVGRAAYLGTGTSTGFDALGTGPVAVSVWTFDTSGNVGAPRSLVVGAAAATPDRHVPIPRTAPPPVRRPVGLLRLAR